MVVRGQSRDKSLVKKLHQMGKELPQGEMLTGSVRFMEKDHFEQLVFIADLGWLCAAEAKSWGKLVQRWIWVSVEELDGLSGWGNGKGLVLHHGEPNTTGLAMRLLQ